MKKISIVFASSLLLAVSVASNAGADNRPVTLTPGAAFVIARPANWVLTTVKGTIHTPPGGAPTNPAGFGCADLSVSASSKEMVQPADGFAYPKWQHSGVATGSWAGGSCTYSFGVVPNSPFNLQLSWGNHNACDYVTGLNVAPGGTGPFTVAKGGTKVQDYTLTGATSCHWIQ